jgi:hypothetical protein
MEKLRAALDTPFLLALEAGSRECEQTVARLEALKAEFVVSDTVLQEIVDLKEKGSFPAVREMAGDLIPRLHDHYGFKTDGLRSTDNGIAEIVADKLLANRVLSGATKNDALIVAEASLHHCAILITLEPVLLNADTKRLNVVLMESHAAILEILSPALILRG